MTEARPRAVPLAGVMVACLVATGTTELLAQNPTPWSLSPQPATGRQVVPFFEGWYDNGDGTYTLSFGYLNRNPEQIVEIPIGDRNYMEPAELDGRQPTTFHASRHRGFFAVTIPASMRDTDVWWSIVDEGDGQTYTVPGRTSAAAYQLDWMPRAHGSLAPLVWLESERDAVEGPEGVWAENPLATRVGQPATLTIHTRDPSERDPEDRRFRETIPVRVVWSKYQGPPGEITFPGHEPRRGPAPNAPGRYPTPVGAITTLEEGRGTASVDASFAVPGEYVILATADNFRSPDSSPGDQCCWTNAYLRVSVAP